MSRDGAREGRMEELDCILQTMWRQSETGDSDDNSDTSSCLPPHYQHLHHDHRHC